MPILIQNARVLTLDSGAVPRRGYALGLLAPLDPGDVLIDGGVIVAVEPSIQRDDPRSPTFVAPGQAVEVVEAGGRVLMPAFVDAHTHALWAGDRLDEWGTKLGWHSSPSCEDDEAQPYEDTGRRPVPPSAPPSYLDILKSGGGIMSTVRAVRGAKMGELRDALLERLFIMLSEGTTTVEVKSGYGLSTEDELKMLRAIAKAAKKWPGTIAPTALIGHAIDPEQDDFVSRTIDETLPAVHEEFPDIAIDAYCESGAWSLDDCRRLFEKAAELGHPLRVHADQFNALGMTRLAIEMGFVSVDHLEATAPEDLRALAESKTFGVMLPCSGFQVDDRYADGRTFVDAGGALAIATNCNPGSAPTSSMPFAVALAVRKLGLSPAEAIAACTTNGAALLGFEDRGAIAPGMRADVVILRHRDERMLAYEFGGNPVELVVCGGEVVG